MRREAGVENQRKWQNPSGNHFFWHAQANHCYRQAAEPHWAGMTVAGSPLPLSVSPHSERMQHSIIPASLPALESVRA